MSAVILKADVIGRLIQRLAVQRKRDGWHCYSVVMSPTHCRVHFAKAGAFLSYRWNDQLGEFHLAGSSVVSDNQGQPEAENSLARMLAKSRLGA